MKSQRRFAPKSDRNKPESVTGLAGISRLFERALDFEFGGCEGEGRGVETRL